MSPIIKIESAGKKSQPQENLRSDGLPGELHEVPSPFKTNAWRWLTPGERLRRSWRMRSRLPDLKATHDRKLFPKP